MRRLGIAALWVVAVLGIAELGVRAWTFAAWQMDLRRFPAVEERYDRARDESRQRAARGPIADLPSTAFPTVPEREEPRFGVMRIAFLGGATTALGYPERVGRLLLAEVGEGRVEVVNLGVDSVNSGEALAIAQKFLPIWRPNLVVLYGGLDDLVVRGAEATRTRGLLEVLLGRGSGEPGALAGEAMRLQSEQDYWELSRLCWRLDAELLVSLPAAPDYASLSSEDREYFEADLRVLWPALGSTDRYSRSLSGYRDMVRRTAARAGIGVIDVAGGLVGGRDLFVDNARFTDAGMDRHAAIAAAALKPRVEFLQARGGWVAVPRPAPLQPLPLPAPATAPAPVPGKCVRGPCPDGMCYAPAQDVRFGVSPGAPVRVSPLCVDRAEASVASHTRCMEEGACPRVIPDEAVRGLDARSWPSVFPTPFDADAYCAWRGGRLPTDVEWEGVARGADGRVFPWGDRWTGNEANFAGREVPGGASSEPDDHVVGESESGLFLSPAPFGTVDNAGNLWEWVADCFVDDVSAAFGGGATDPVVTAGDGDCRRFLRGGSFRSAGRSLERRCAGAEPDVQADSRGVRCVMDFGTQHQELPAPGILQGGPRS